MMTNFRSNKTLDLENKRGITYIAEMFDGSELYRAFETNLIISKAEELYITGQDKDDIKKARKGLEHMLKIKLQEIKEKPNPIFPYDRHRYQPKD